MRALEAEPPDVVHVPQAAEPEIIGHTIQKDIVAGPDEQEAGTNMRHRAAEDQQLEAVAVEGGSRQEEQQEGDGELPGTVQVEEGGGVPGAHGSFSGTRPVGPRALQRSRSMSQVYNCTRNVQTNT